MPITQDGRQVNIPMRHMALHQEVLPYLHAAISRINTEGREFIKQGVLFSQILGDQQRVTTQKGDRIVYARRPGRKCLTRFVLDKEPTPSNCVTVIMRRTECGDYKLYTAFIGTPAEKEVGDASMTADEMESSIRFWSCNALVWGTQEVIEGTVGIPFTQE